MFPGLAAGLPDGLFPGLESGLSDGFVAGLDPGLSLGFAAGFDSGFVPGLSAGFAAGLPEDGFEGVRSAGLISAFLVLVLLFLSSDLTEVEPVLRPEVDDVCREPAEDDLALPRDCALKSNWKTVNANPISIAANVFADNLIII